MTPIPTEPDLRNELADDEIDRHIKSLGRLSEKAMANGDPTGARIWSDRMLEAIASRSPEKKALDEGVDYFAVRGAQDRERLKKSGRSA